MSIDLGEWRDLPNSVRVLNCTPHPLVFVDTRYFGEPITVMPCGATLKAKVMESSVGRYFQSGAVFVTPAFAPTEEGLRELEEIEKSLPFDVLIVGSIISAQAYPGRVVAAVTSMGDERKPPEKKTVTIEKFTIFPPSKKQKMRGVTLNKKGKGLLATNEY